MLSYTNKEIFKKEEKLMSKKVKVLISALVIAVLLTMGGVTMVMAEGEEETAPSPEASENALLERVADILGIDEEDLINAFEQARQEMCEDAFTSHINQAVEEGLITQDQADEILEWWSQRPDDAIEAWRGQGPNATGPGMFKNAPRFRFSLGNRRGNCFGWGFCPEAPEETN